MRVDVWSDFVCPWCYLLSISLAKLQASHGVDIRWHSYELRSKNAPPVSPEHRQSIEAQRPDFEAAALAEYGVKINSGKWGIDSRPALIGSKYAEQQGVASAYNQAMFEAYWLHAQPIDELDVVVHIAEKVGLARDAFLLALKDPMLDIEVESDIATARAFQITGVPALIIAERYFIPGAQPYDELVKLVEYVRQREMKG
jgi:predicted DsbA family dithiol-disulfide isomerase